MTVRGKGKVDRGESLEKSGEGTGEEASREAEGVGSFTSYVSLRSEAQGVTRCGEVWQGRTDWRTKTDIRRVWGVPVEEDEGI